MIEGFGLLYVHDEGGTTLNAAKPFMLIAEKLRSNGEVFVYPHITEGLPIQYIYGTSSNNEERIINFLTCDYDGEECKYFRGLRIFISHGGPDGSIDGLSRRVVKEIEKRARSMLDYCFSVHEGLGTLVLLCCYSSAFIERHFEELKYRMRLYDYIFTRKSPVVVNMYLISGIYELLLGIEPRKGEKEAITFDVVVYKNDGGDIEKITGAEASGYLNLLRVM